MAKFQWLNDESLLEEVVYGELDARLSDLVTQIQQIDGGFVLLRFLGSNANTLRTVDDIAYYLHQATPAVEKSLRAMLRLALVRRVEAGGMAWFGMTRDPDCHQMVCDLGAWQDRWHARLGQLDRIVSGNPSLASEGLVSNHSEFRPLA